MGTVVDNCNLALGLLGDRATLTSIDPPEGSAQADHCARFYPMARDEALERYDWGFASTYADLTDLELEHDVYAYTYSLPADCLLVRELVYTDGSVVMLDPESPQFEMSSIDTGSNVLLSHATAVSCRYTKRVANPTKYSSGFNNGLVYLVASFLAGPIIKGKSGVQTAQAMRIQAEKLLDRAAVTDANQNSKRPHHIPSSVWACGYGGRDVIIERGQERYSLPFWAQ